MKWAECHPDRPARARGLCSKCYSADYHERVRNGAHTPKSRKDAPKPLRHNDPVDDNTWARVQSRTTTDESGCEVVDYATDSRGVPRMYFGEGREDRWVVSIPILAWRRYYGSYPPKGHSVRQSCGNRRCIRVDHLRLLDYRAAPADAYRAKLAEWMDRGHTLEEIARAAALLPSVVRELHDGTASSVPYGVQRALDDVVLNSDYEQADPTLLQRIINGDNVPLTGSIAKGPYVRALRELGWPNTRISRVLGVNNRWVDRLCGAPSPYTKGDGARLTTALQQIDALTDDVKHWKDMHAAAVDRESRWRDMALQLKNKLEGNQS